MFALILCCYLPHISLSRLQLYLFCVFGLALCHQAGSQIQTVVNLRYDVG